MLARNTCFIILFNPLCGNVHTYLNAAESWKDLKLLSANPTKWSNISKQFVGYYPLCQREFFINESIFLFFRTCILMEKCNGESKMFLP